MSHYLIAFGIALSVALLTTPLVKNLALRIGAVDRPNKRKVHTRVMPRLGGLAIVIAFMAAFLPLIPFYKGEYGYGEVFGILLGGSIIALVGALDDKYQLSPRAKLFGQLLAAVVVVAFGLKVEFINLPFDGQLPFGWLSYPVTVFWIVAVTNAINLIDGLDGLAGGVSAIATATMMTIAWLLGNVVVVLFCAALLGATIGFLFFNFHPAKIFMGDTGALFLGFNLAALSVLGFKSTTVIAFVIPLLILGVPLSDTFFAIVRRIVNRKPISQADKNHLHHCLLNMGFSHRQTVLVIYGISFFFGTMAVIFFNSMETLWAALLVIGIVVILLQLGAEVTGLVSDKKKPVINFFRGLRYRYLLFLRSK
ncbi:MraY family glycosyltransferase [Bacillaceae bacterium]